MEKGYFKFSFNSPNKKIAVNTVVFMALRLG